MIFIFVSSCLLKLLPRQRKSVNKTEIALDKTHHALIVIIFNDSISGVVQ
ncbi:hypothetical protein HMPREF1987_02014 [Peptostreptococcaceae bacterium oral taxon 113 str. W5053]|nr:hypothetical protein HMPREF1987_02014 [Peptostreptococcaceae bacterium oral taxon 113 str. W5053]